MSAAGDPRDLPWPVEVPGWPRPRGYANGVVGRGRVLFVAGQIGWDAERRFASRDLAAQFGQALANVLAVVAAAGGGPEHVASMTVYVTDIAAYRAGQAAIGAAWRAHMGKVFPAMALVAVSALVEPEAVVEIQAQALLP
ncbi:MAG TPA: RidA family protein [Kofleriaceae bacterium]|nr:RidA family protein [Kofleriaceae bacterium]